MAGIFREYDIRGVYPSELNEKNAYLIGVAAAKFLKANKIIVGRDGRTSSPKLQAALIKGIADCGTDITDIGLVSTPMFYHACAVMKQKGIMVTASHNPKEYNGFKVSDDRPVPYYYEDGINRIERIFLELKNKKIKITRKGKIAKKDITQGYVNYLRIKFLKNYRNLSVVIDFSNGAGAVSKQVFDRLKIKNRKICDKIDGRFPCHGPNPLIKNSAKKLSQEVKRSKADFGIIFDGDADRVFFVDEKGNFVKTDYAFAVLAEDELNKKKGSVYYDLRFSLIVEETIRKSGGKPKIMRVGNNFMKEALLKDKNSVIAAEYSDHIMYRENFCIDDGLFAALKMINIVSKGKKLSELVKPLKKYAISDEISFQVKNKDNVLKSVEEKYKNHTIMKIDGISVYAKDCWFNIRKSNTEPKVRMRAEAKDSKALKKLVKRLSGEIKESGR